MREAINVLDCGYKIHEVCQAFNICRTILRDHYNGRIKERKMGSKFVLTKKEEDKLVDYVLEMGSLAHPLTLTDLKFKVVEICQTRHTPFKDGILGKSWSHWFKIKHPHLVLRQA